MWSECSRKGKDRVCNGTRGYGTKELDGYKVDGGKE